MIARPSVRQGLTVLLLGAAIACPAGAQEPDVKAAAKAHFDAGNGLLSRGDVAAALAEFQRSRALFPTRGNSLNTAIALQRLGRFDEALEMYLTLPRDFALAREERARVDREIELLRALTGKLTIRVEPGTSVSIDGRERGVSPFSEPLWVLAGSHSVRAHKSGRADFERRVEIVTGAEQELIIELAAPVAAGPEAPPAPPAPPSAPPPSPAPPAAPATTARDRPTAPPARDAGAVLAVDVGPAIGLGFGGPLADSCGAGCKAPAPFGFSARARGGYRVGPQVELGLELGYARLSGRYENREDTLEPQGAGPQPGRSDDQLGASTWSLGGYAGWSGTGRVHARASLGFGLAFGRFSDERDGSYAVAPPVGEPYQASASIEQKARAVAIYFEPAFGFGVTLAPRLELGASLALVSSIALSTPRFERGSDVITNAAGKKELAYFRASDLTGGVFFSLAPRLGVSFRF
jgi:hypothetical protein